MISFLAFLNAFFRSRYSLGLEILALRQQLRVLKRKHPHPRLRVETEKSHVRTMESLVIVDETPVPLVA